MKTFVICSGLVAALTACGGGDDSPAKLDFAAGNSLTYATATTAVAGDPSFLASSISTRTLLSVRADGGYELLITSNTDKAGGESVNADHFVTFKTNGVSGCTYSAGQTGPGKDVVLNETWNSRFTESCSFRSSPVMANITHNGKVVAEENITTKAGTFDTYKYTFDTSSRSSSGFTQESGTCWLDKTLNRNVACDSRQAFTTAGASTPRYIRDITQRLTSLDIPGYSQTNPSAERFAGGWRLGWTGTAGGLCLFDLPTSGSFSGGVCVFNNDSVNTVAMSGTVSADGKFSATLVNGMSFTGNFADLTAATGSWRTNSGTTGTWTASHQ